MEYIIAAGSYDVSCQFDSGANFYRRSMPAMQTEIYLDANATSAVLPAAIAAAGTAMRDSFGNPSSSHATRPARQGHARRGAQRAPPPARRGRRPPDVYQRRHRRHPDRGAVGAVRHARAARQRARPSATCCCTAPPNTRRCRKAWRTGTALLGTGLELRALPVDGVRPPRPRRAARTGAARGHGLHHGGQQRDRRHLRPGRHRGGAVREPTARAYWMVDSVQALGKLRPGPGARPASTTRRSPATSCMRPRASACCTCAPARRSRALMMGGGQEDRPALRHREHGRHRRPGRGARRAGRGPHASARHDGAGQLPRAPGRRAAQRAARASCSTRRSPTRCRPRSIFRCPALPARSCSTCSTRPACASAPARPVPRPRPRPAMCSKRCSCRAWRSAAAVRMSFGPMADDAFIAAACARIAHCGEALRATCLIPSAMPAESRDGIVQLGVDGECTWLVLDAASRSCVIIDPLEPLAARIADFIRCQGYQVRARDRHPRACGLRVGPRPPCCCCWPTSLTAPTASIRWAGRRTANASAWATACWSMP